MTCRDTTVISDRDMKTGLWSIPIKFENKNTNDDKNQSYTRMKFQTPATQYSLKNKSERRNVTKAHAIAERD